MIWTRVVWERGAVVVYRGMACAGVDKDSGEAGQSHARSLVAARV